MLKCCNAFDEMKHIPKGSVDMAITSPPYYNARKYKEQQSFKSLDEWGEFSLNMILEMSNVVKDSGVIWWNVAQMFINNGVSPILSELIVELSKRNIHLVIDIPWIKTSCIPYKVKHRPRPAWEHNYVFSRHPELVEFYVDHVRTPYKEGSLKRIKYQHLKMSPTDDGNFVGRPRELKLHKLGATPPDYLLFPQDASRRPHPGIMQPLVANWAIRAYTEKGDIVFDPMTGCGTTWVECIKLERDFIGFELESKYVELSKLSASRFYRGLHPYNGLKKEWEEIQSKQEKKNDL